MNQLETAAGDELIRFDLDAILDIRASEPLKNSFLDILSSGQKKVVVDASQVERMSTPCIQVLLSAMQRLEKEEIETSLRQPSEAFINAFDDLGLFPVLMQWKVEA